MATARAVFFKQKNPVLADGISSRLPPRKVAAPLLVAIAAQKLIQPARVGLERQGGNRSSALGAFPVSLVHPALSAVTVIVISHFALKLISTILLASGQNGLTDNY